ncbi:MAG TPA: hypothetical protein V6C85_21855, partial [Allocoleopsis sp.]
MTMSLQLLNELLFLPPAPQCKGKEYIQSPPELGNLGGITGCRQERLSDDGGRGRDDARGRDGDRGRGDDARGEMPARMPT